MATLWHNFELPDLTVTAKMPDGRMFRDYDGTVVRPGEVARIRWGGLWLAHDAMDRSKKPERVVYVVRNPVDTLMSFWRFCDPLMLTAPSRFIGYESVKHWHHQLLSYIMAGCMIIRYEDLVGTQHDYVLHLLESRFGLKCKRERFERLMRKVGWYSSIEPLQSPDPPKLLLNAVAEQIPKGFLGYNIGA